MEKAEGLKIHNEELPNYNRGRGERQKYKEFISTIEGMGCFDNQLSYETTGAKNG